MNWISAIQASILLGIKPSTVIKRIQKGIYKGHQSTDQPYSSDGKPVWIVLVESLPSFSQKEFYKTKDNEQKTSLNLLKARSILGDYYLKKALTITEMIQDSNHIQTNGSKTQQMKELARANNISLSTLYRIIGSKEAKQASKLYQDPALDMINIPKTMCKKSTDLIISMHIKGISQVNIFYELNQTVFYCKNCEFYSENNKTKQCCKKQIQEKIYIPNNTKAISRLLQNTSPQLKALNQQGKIEFVSHYGLFALRSKTMCFGELWEADHKILSPKVAIQITKEKNSRHYSKILLVHPVVTAFIDTTTKLYTGIVLSIIPNSDTIADAFIEAVRNYAPPANIRTDCGKDYKSLVLQALPQEFHNFILKEDTFLNRHFAGCGVLRLFGTEVNSAIPYHPQAKPCIERSFRILDALTVQTIGTNRIFSYEQFANIFFSEILPQYQNTPWKYSGNNSPDDWEIAYKDKSPMERYYLVPSVRTTKPSQEDLSLLRFHRKDNCKVRANGIQFSNCWYYAKELEHFTGPDGPKVSIQYNRVSSPLAPNSISVIYNNSFVCEAFAMETLLQHHENIAQFKYFLDSRNRRISDLNSSIKRINKSAQAVLPEKYKDKQMPNKLEQMRNMELIQNSELKHEKKQSPHRLNSKLKKKVKEDRFITTSIINDLNA